MTYHFFSHLSCAFKVNGQFKGILNLTPITINLSPSDFIEIIPCENYLSINFIASRPSTMVNFINTPFGVYAYPISFRLQNLEYKNLFSHKYNDCIIKVIADFNIKLFLNTTNDTFIEQLPFIPTKTEVFYKDNRYIGLLFCSNKQLLIIKELSTFDTVFYKFADEFKLQNNTIYSLTQTPSLLKHTIKYTYQQGNQTREVFREKETNSLVNTKLFCFAFLECVALKDDLSCFLKGGINQEKIIEFIGEFYQILPSPTPKYDFALVGEKVKFIKFNLENDLICDFILD